MNSEDRPIASLEAPGRIEPARLEDVPEALSDIVAELAAAAAKLGSSLSLQTAANLAGLDGRTGSGRFPETLHAGLAADPNTSR